jgi:UDP-N-acetylmuramate dehydrogenase
MRYVLCAFDPSLCTPAFALFALVHLLPTAYYIPMHMRYDVSLADYSTMRLGGPAKALCQVSDKPELIEAVHWAQQKHWPVIVIGGGSNIIWSDEGFPGLVIVNHITGFSIVEDHSTGIVTIGAGENWDESVARTVAAGLSGIEALSLIPGTAGATPVQNVGAYGQEIADTLISVEAYDVKSHQLITLLPEDCDFGYRTSRFKTGDKERFFITEIKLELQRINPRPPYYPAVADYLRANRINVVTPKVLREAVIAIRTAKLPDPAKVANNGSFFGNPMITKSAFQKLAKKYPDLPHWPTKDGKIKIPAAWLIEQAGLKGYEDNKTGMATWPKQPLVFVNKSAAATADLIAFRNHFITTVQAKFGVTLEQEPELISRKKLKT